jgi:uncharacterized protein (UPF0147 family)
MKIKVSITYTEEEIQKMIDTLAILSEMVDDENIPTQLQTLAADAFDKVSKILGQDKNGELAMNDEGW